MVNGIINWYRTQHICNIGFINKILAILAFDTDIIGVYIISDISKSNQYLKPFSYTFIYLDDLVQPTYQCKSCLKQIKDKTSALYHTSDIMKHYC